MQYTVIKSKTIEGVAMSVNAHLKQGWRTRGGIAQSANHLLQAMERKA